MIRFFCAVVGLGSLVTAVGIHVSPLGFIDLSSLLVVLVPSLALTAATHGPKSLGAALNAGIGGPCAEPRTETQAILQTLRNLLCCSGALGTLLGLVIMLHNLDDPSAIGPSMAVALLSALYGLGLGELVVGPMIAHLESEDSALTRGRFRCAVLSAFAVALCSGIVLLLIGVLSNHEPEANENSYSYTIEVADPDGDPVNLTLVEAPRGAQLTNTVVTWTPEAEHSGLQHKFHVLADDGNGGSVSQVWHVVVPRGPNRDPSILSIPGTQATTQEPVPHPRPQADKANEKPPALMPQPDAGEKQPKDQPDVGEKQTRSQPDAGR